jgi:hypothetical protein
LKLPVPNIPTSMTARIAAARRDLTLSGTGGLDSQDCTAWRHLDGGNAPAIQHHEPVTMAGAKHARLFRKRFNDSLDDLVLVDRVVFIPDVELVTTHESDPQHYLYHAHALTSVTPGRPRGRLPLASKSRSVQLSSIKTQRHDHAGPDLPPFHSLRRRKERPLSGERCARTAHTRPLKGAPATNLLRSRRIHDHT